MDFLKIRDMKQKYKLSKKVFRVLNNPYVQLIVSYFEENKNEEWHTVGMIYRVCRVEQSVASKFLGEMQDIGLVTSKRMGQLRMKRFNTQRYNRINQVNSLLHTVMDEEEPVTAS